MRRSAQRQQERAMGGARSQEVEIPLPIKGVMTRSKSAEMSGLYCEVLESWHSNGMTLEAESRLENIGHGTVLLEERLPFQFNGLESYLELEGDRVRFDGKPFYVDLGTIHGHEYISSHLMILSETAGPVSFDGERVQARIFTTSTDMDPREFTGISSHYDTLYFWKADDTLDFYYGEIGEIEGDLTRYPLGRLGGVTGTIVAARSITLDANDGIRNLLCVFTSTGMMVAFDGINPGDPDNWSIFAKVQVSPIIAQDAFVHVGADLWMLTEAGVLSVQETLRSGRMAYSNAVTVPVKRLIQEALRLDRDWQMHFAADGSVVIINEVAEDSARQFIYHPETGAWQVENHAIRAWHNLGGETHATGFNGELFRYDPLGVTDGDPVTAVWETGWFRMPRRASITYLKPTLISNGELDVKITVLVDHNDQADDYEAGEQTITMEPDDPGQRVALNERIGVDAVGDVFKIRIEATASWMEFVNLKAGVM